MVKKSVVTISFYDCSFVSYRIDLILVSFDGESSLENISIIFFFDDVIDDVTTLEYLKSVRISVFVTPLSGTYSACKWPFVIDNRFI